MNRCSAIALSLALGCSACASSVHVARIDPESLPTKAPTGVPWNLAMTQYTVTITRQVTKCGNVLDGNVTVSAVGGKTKDRDQQYVLSSSGIWATADITSTLAPDGTSTGLNAHSEDQTATAISNTLGIMVAAAKLGAGAAAQHFTCSDAVSKALLVLKPATGTPLKEKIDAETSDIALLTTRLTQLTTAYQGGGQSGGGKGAGVPDKSPLLAAIDEIQTKQRTLNADQAALSAALKVLTTVQTVTWPTSAQDAETDAAFELDPSVAQSWVTWVGSPNPKPSVPADKFKVWLGLYRSDGKGGWAIPTKKPLTGDVKVGVPIRLAATGRLLACTKDKCPAVLDANWEPSDTQTLAIQPDITVLQFGQLYNVPLTGGTFKSEGAVVALDSNGIPTSVEISEKQAAAAAATGALQSAATTVAALPDQIAAQKLAKTQATTNQINADNARAGANAATPYAAGTAAANAQAASANANTALATALANAQSAGQAGQMAAQAALANQATELANAQSTLAGAQANATVAQAVAALSANTTLINATAAQINARVAVTQAEAALNE